MIQSGGTSYILPRFSPDTVLETLEREKITVFFGPPTMYTIMLNSPNIKKYHFNLRIAFTGSAPMAVKIHKQWEELFGFSILEGYGLSECSPIVSNHRPEGVKKPGSIGPALPGVNVKIVDENDQEVPIREKGEVVVSGPNVMKGYWNRKEETEITLRNGWLHTGDIGYQDEDGYFYIIDRKKDLINRGGMKIYPREIEEVLYQYQTFLEVSVVGEVDEVLGEEIVAYVTLKEKDKVIKLEDVQSFCKEKLAPYKVPRKLYIIDEMPKTLSGKIQKIALRK
jgi:long-chain acyl-CoA synthetase